MVRAAHLSRTWSAAAIAAMLAAVFVLDTVTNLEIAAAVFYVVPVLIAVRRFPRRGVMALAALCAALTIVSSLLTTSGAREPGLINLAISITAIGVTTWLGLRMIDAEGAFHDARAQLLRVARVTSLGGLTASIAHEVNQPLAAIAASGDAARRWLDAASPNLEKARDALDRIVGDAGRASAVIARLRGMARSDPPKRDWVSLDAIVEDTVALAGAEIERHGITLSLALAPGAPTLRLDRVQMVQVLANLVLNAIEAMASPIPRRELTISSSIDDDRTLSLIVSDTGPGIPATDLPHLFEAFWTSKRGGTGLGLTLSRAIVESHGGLLRAEWNPGGGARFIIEFPPTTDRTP